MRRVADDGVGLAVAERVSGLGLSKVDVAKYCEDACALMEAWEGYGNVILVDATQSGAMPGTVRSFDSRAMPPTKRAFGISTHGFGCMDACAVGSPSHRRETAGPAKRCKCSTTGGDHHRTPRHRYGSRSSPRAIVNLPAMHGVNSSRQAVMAIARNWAACRAPECEGHGTSASSGVDRRGLAGPEPLRTPMDAVHSVGALCRSRRPRWRLRPKVAAATSGRLIWRSTGSCVYRL